MNAGSRKWSRLAAAALTLALWGSYLAVVAHQPLAAVGILPVGRWILVTVKFVLSGELDEGAFYRWMVREGRDLPPARDP